MVPDAMLPCAMGRGFVSARGFWNVGFARAIGLFILGDSGFGDTGAAIGLFALGTGGLSCCGDSFGVCAAAGNEDNRESNTAAPALRKEFKNIARPFLETGRIFFGKLIWTSAEVVADLA
jgi:hypothetical protein